MGGLGIDIDKNLLGAPSDGCAPVTLLVFRQPSQVGVLWNRKFCPEMKFVGDFGNAVDPEMIFPEIVANRACDFPIVSDRMW